MKKIAAVFFLVMTYCLSAWAEPVFLYPTCSNWGIYGECTLNNISGKQVSCNVNVNGSTKSGQMITQYQYSILFPYQTTWIRVTPRDAQNDPISYLTANAFCNTLN